MRLEDIPLDIGYASEQVTLSDESGKSYTIAGQNGKTQLLISAPFIDDSFISELKKIEAMIPKEDENEVAVTLIVANNKHQNPHLKGFDFLIDTQGEFADWYGLKLISAPLEGEFTKAIMLISKDGALFHDDYPMDMQEPFNHEMLYRKIVAAQTCYTGKGCH
jgi:thiol peroxidase